MEEPAHVHSKDVINRLSRATGHLQAVKKMIEEHKDCSEVLIQLSAVKSALNKIGQIILKDHIERCIVDAAKNDDKETLDKLMKAIERIV